MPLNHQTASVLHETWHTRPPRDKRLVVEDEALIGFPIWELEPDFCLAKIIYLIIFVIIYDIYKRKGKTIINLIWYVVFLIILIYFIFYEF